MQIPNKIMFYFYVCTADFIKKGTFSVHSFNDNYLSIPECPGS